MITDSELSLFRRVILELLDRLDRDRVDQSQKMDELTKKLCEIRSDSLRSTQGLERRVEFLESEILYLRDRVDRNEYLEYMENPYSNDGRARCDY